MANDAKPRAARPRRLMLALLVPPVLLVHGLLAERLAGLLATAAQSAGAPARLQAVFVRELQPAEAPKIAAAKALPMPALPVPRRLAAAPPPPVAASEAQTLPAPQTASAQAPPLPPPQAASAEAADASVATAPAQPAAAEAQPPAPAASAPAPGSGFTWPPSTRLSYTLIGDVRGEVRGEAQVEWVREGLHYQVHLDVVIGPGFAPVARRHISSDGELTPHGLAPRRYDESTRLAFGQPRRLTIRFDEDGVTLADGRRAAAMPALQDSASQFVQLTWLFLTGAERLEAGRQVEVPLALPRRIDRWVYDVVGEEQLHTPFGLVAAWHLRPQRPPRPDTLAVEAWFAPSLQYLPVRIVIREGSGHYIDLMIERLPQQALAPQGVPGERAVEAAQDARPVLR